MKKIKTLFILVLTVFLLSGCISIKGDGIADGGVFKSEDKGDNWQQRVLIPSISGEPGSISGTNIISMTLDPQDHKAIYVGTEGDGLFFSYNSALSWFKAGGLPDKAPVYDVAVDPKSKCTIYVAIGNSIYKSMDCNRTWSRIYFETDVSKKINNIEIDWFNPNMVYASTSTGDLLKTSDGGRSWSPVNKFKRDIKDLKISNIDSRVVYVLVRNRGVYKTTDGGANWSDVNEGLKELSKAMEVKEIVIDQSKKEGQDSMIISTAGGLFKSDDGGTTWSEITLLTLTEIYSLAVNPKNFNDIYYGTATTFYSSNDGGQNWTTKKLSTSRVANKLLVDFEKPEVIFMGAKKIESDTGFGL